MLIVSCDKHVLCSFGTLQLNTIYFLAYCYYYKDTKRAQFSYLCLIQYNTNIIKSVNSHSVTPYALLVHQLI